MDKCRICWKRSKTLRSLYNAEDGITLLEMLTYFANIKINSNGEIAASICLSCRRKLKEAYAFKIEIERSEMILNESFYKRIYFNNIRDLNFKIDCKPVVPAANNYFDDLFKGGEHHITYKDTEITRIKGENNNQMSVKEFLNSVIMESDNDYCNQDYEVDIKYASENDSDYGKKKNKKKKSKKGKQTKKVEYLKKPIKPILLNNVKIGHAEKVKSQIIKPKKKYKYPVKTSVCPHCGKILVSKYLNLHISQHTSIRPYKCNECSKAFVSKKYLELHIKKHTAPKIFKCSQCIASFISRVTLNAHMLVHTVEKKYTCEICSKAFKRKSTLHRHLLIHNFGKKPIQCELCPMSFHTKCALKHHMRIHTGERPFKCEICSQPYSYKHDFNRHCLKKHGVFLKQRRINIMNEEVLEQEKALMAELALKSQSNLKEEDIPSVFLNARGALALNQAMKALEARQIPIT